MPLVRRIRKRGANIVVEAHGEVLFAATGDVGRWTNRFSNRARAFAAQEAPTNKRPRWAHYGRELRDTFTASTTYQPGNMRVYSAIGSSSPHAYYVDQGTGVFAGNGPYAAKILPPWRRGSASLYEATWRPGGANGPRVAPVMIKGQRGQFFFDEGLKRAFQSMRMRSAQLPGEGGPKISNALRSVPTGLENFAGNTPSNKAFIAQLEEWRAWRDGAWRLHENLGRSGAAGRYRERQGQRRAHDQAARQERRRQQSVERSRRWREEQKAKSTNKPKQRKNGAEAQRARAAEKQRFLAAMIERYGARNVDTGSLTFKGGYYYILIRTMSETPSGDIRPEWVERRGKSKI